MLGKLIEAPPVPKIFTVPLKNTGSVTVIFDVPPAAAASKAIKLPATID